MFPPQITFNHNPYAPTEPSDIAQLIVRSEFQGHEGYFGQFWWGQQPIPYPTTAFDVLRVLRHIKDKDLLQKYVDFQKETGHPVHMEVFLPPQSTTPPGNVHKPDFCLSLEPRYTDRCYGRLSTTGCEGVVILDFMRKF